MQIQEELISKTTVIGVALVGILTIVFNAGVFTVWGMLAGGVSLLLLLSYSKHGDVGQTRIEHALTSAVYALSSLLLLGWLLLPLYRLLGLAVYGVIAPGGIRLSVTWAVFAFAFWLVATFIWTRIHPRQRWHWLFQPANLSGNHGTDL